jgi:uncharacterized protein YndB with AHSA1/START domain/predicted enzyme related to lactoylglutathione lyase
MTLPSTQPSAQLVLRRTFDAPRERVFAAWTDPQSVMQFLGPADNAVKEANVDFRTGGRYRFTMIGEDGADWFVGGVYREIVAPERIVCTWAWEEDDPALERETVLTLEFFERGDRTELVLTHANLRDDVQRDRHEGGWSVILDQLGTLLAAPKPAVRIAGIDLSGYMVDDAPRAIAFYRDVLGLQPARVYPEGRGAEYDLPDGTTFGLWGGGGKVMPFQPSNGILFAVADLDEAVAALKSRGTPIVREIESPVCRMAMIHDTEGNLVTLHQRKAP